MRIAENVQKLKDIRAVQIAYKNKYQVFASDFNSLMEFLNNDSIAVIRSVGEVPDSLTELQALQAKLISRDTIYIESKTHIFNEDYLSTRDQSTELYIDGLQYIPHTKNKKYSIYHIDC